MENKKFEMSNYKEQPLESEFEKIDNICLNVKFFRRTGK
jgi:hypothetical protein